MDVLYYWRDVAEDTKAGRIGWFRADRKKLLDLQAGMPDRIWVFKTPKGQKGNVQLLARMRWADNAVVPVTRVPGMSYMYYDPAHADSVRFTDSGTPAAIEETTRWMREHFWSSIGGNFQGEHGQQPMRGAVLEQLKRIASAFEAVPFMEPVKA